MADRDPHATRPMPVLHRVDWEVKHRDGERPARRRRRRARLLEAAALGLLAGVAGLFLLDGGGPALAHGPAGDRLLALARLSGLEASAVLLLQMLLAARVPWVDRTFGHDRALVGHRLASRISMPLLLAHVLAVIAGRAERNGLDPGPGWARQTLRLLAGEAPGMITAFVSFGVILLVAATSVRLARRVASHEAWHLVHLTAYAGVALSVPHQLLGPDVAGHPRTRIFWLGLFVATAGTAITFRMLQPLIYSLRHRLVVEQVVPEGAGVVSVVIGGRRLDRLPARAGQFLQWRFLTRGLWAFAHPWSLSAAPDGRRLRITVRAIGDHSRELIRLRPGTRVLVEGPYGTFISERRTRRRVLLLAAGIGITPVRALMEDLAADPRTRTGDLTLLYRAADPASLLFVQEIRESARRHGVKVMFLLGPAAPGSWLPRELSSGGRGADAAALRRLVPGIADHDVYQCGPPGWMTLVRATLREVGVARAQLHDERFVW